MSESKHTPGAVIEIAYPFVRVDVELYDEDGPYKTVTWQPGVRYEPVYPDDTEAVADGVGKQRLTIVSVHRPRPFPTRVFFTRRWIAPNGHEFGKNKLHTRTAAAFTRLTRGYFFPYSLATGASS